MKNIIASLLLMATTLFISTYCADDRAEPTAEQIVWVHGSWQAAFDWDEVKTLQAMARYFQNKQQTEKHVYEPTPRRIRNLVIK